MRIAAMAAGAVGGYFAAHIHAAALAAGWAFANYEIAFG